ncbi:glycosyltransferase [Kaistia geumhonensis]|uniref:Cellulose synthase/poly-beta-1,6-N-acetylglucosamine synthase-like glycosyltransferase n=1 Tax=Kaistia geumhonensis TaxID=410839 RepID=A0ABU0M5Y8_9HYPH|nr:glycosyltransferase family 2 protein [Kaistia geumhonensis]MCX5478416.1 glycosyltransferase [Kaistia geumhonensis]MDQ0516366.1 cellulose synthase/poly-beta-1,6-N-acetylglucosamine synthase-like glycosyltransferase [Kaistia geumhonensis]
MPGADGPGTDVPGAYRTRAAELGLRFIASPTGEGYRARPDMADDVAAIAATIRRGSLAAAERDGERAIFIAPERGDLRSLSARVRADPAIAGLVMVTTPAAVRRLLLARYRMALVRDATERLATRRPDLSARRLVTRAEGAVLATVLFGIAAAIFLLGAPAIAAIEILAGLVFLATILLRMQAISVVTHRRRHRRTELPQVEPESLPVYSILLPVYREPHMLAELVGCMERLVWPREKLDIKLIVEADDKATLAAARVLRLQAPFEVLAVPAFGPRTKPKALAFALPLARGELVTVFDAEDRPDPLQLIEAYLAFQRGGPDLACVQAPLLVDNTATNGLTALFALEYSVQFDGVLPLLADLDLPLPLGGTSNHFRRAVLEDVGGWDPYNVTEDADLGLRLARFGYRTGVIERPTLEEAPRTVSVWLGQRTRWLKGWMQTLLVHLRSPRRLLREIGPRRFAYCLLVLFGSLVAAAIHPVYLATALALIFDPARLWRADSPLFAAMTMLSLFNLVSAYGVFVLLSRETFHLRHLPWPASALVYLPAYWLLLSIACYRAIGELIIAPHHWSKTRHVGRRVQPAVQRAEATEKLAQPVG